MNDESLELVGYLDVSGTRGYSAYEVAVQNGFIGTEEDWLESLIGPQGEEGPNGKSAYEVAVDNGYEGTEEEWVNDFLTPDGYYTKDEIDARVVDALTSIRGDKFLSAKQGKILNDTITENDNYYRETFATQDSVNEILGDISDALEAIVGETL